MTDSHVRFCYAHDDHVIAMPLAATLRERGIVCRMIQCGLPAEAGSAGEKKDVTEPDVVQPVVLIFSASSAGSEEVRAATEDAVRRNAPLIAVRIGKAEISRELAAPLSRAHWLDASRSPPESHTGLLAVKICRMLTLKAPERVTKAPAGEIDSADRAAGWLVETLHNLTHSFGRWSSTVYTLVAGVVLAVLGSMWAEANNRKTRPAGPLNTDLLSRELTTGSWRIVSTEGEQWKTSTVGVITYGDLLFPGDGTFHKGAEWTFCSDGVWFNDGKSGGPLGVLQGIEKQSWWLETFEADPVSGTPPPKLTTGETRFVPDIKGNRLILTLQSKKKTPEMPGKLTFERIERLPRPDDRLRQNYLLFLPALMAGVAGLLWSRVANPAVRSHAFMTAFWRTIVCGICLVAAVYLGGIFLRLPFLTGLPFVFWLTFWLVQVLPCLAAATVAGLVRRFEIKPPAPGGAAMQRSAQACRKAA